MIEKQIERLTARRAGHAGGRRASAGAEFSAALATVDGIDVRDGEQCCADLARRGQFLRALGIGRVAGRDRRGSLRVHPRDLSQRAVRARRDRAPRRAPPPDRCAPRACPRDAGARDRGRAGDALRARPRLRARDPLPRAGGRHGLAPARATARPSITRGGRSSCSRRCPSRQRATSRS